MEIISYVQDNSRARSFGSFRPLKTLKPLKTLALPELQFKHKERSKSASITSNIFSPELKSFSAQKVKSDFSARTFFRMVGSAVTEAGIFVSDNSKRLLIIFFAALAATTITIFSLKLISHNINHTGPLTFREDD